MSGLFRGEQIADRSIGPEKVTDDFFDEIEIDLSNYVTLDTAQTITGNKVFNAQIESSNILPITTNTYTLGSNDYRYGSIFAVNLNNTGYVSTGGKTALNDGISGVFANSSGNMFLTGDTNFNPGLYWLRNGETSAYTASIINSGNNVLTFTSSILPSSSIFNLGTSTLRWNLLYAGEVLTGLATDTGVGIGSVLGRDGSLYLNNASNATITFYSNNTSRGYISSTGNNVLSTNMSIIPVINNMYNLGSSDYRWSTIYADSFNGINISSDGDGTKALFDDGTYKTIETSGSTGSSMIEVIEIYNTDSSTFNLYFGEDSAINRVYNCETGSNVIITVTLSPSSLVSDKIYNVWFRNNTLASNTISFKVGDRTINSTIVGTSTSTSAINSCGFKIQILERNSDGGKSATIQALPYSSSSQIGNYIIDLT